MDIRSLMKNVIILGAGRTGSSLLAGLIAHNRYYINAEKIAARKAYPDGDYENPDLVDLNQKILLDSGYGYSKVMAHKPVDIAAIEQLALNTRDDVYADFLKQCEENRPWLWKDPRLCYTIYFWNSFLDLNDIQFIKITRDPYLVFRSHSKFQIKDTKKNIITNYYKQNDAVDAYLKKHGIKALTVDYSEMKNQNVFKKLNDYLQTDISPDDYRAIKKENISKKEPDYKFMLRYMLGSGVLKLQNFIRRSR